jgi:hypothetical protein
MMFFTPDSAATLVNLSHPIALTVSVLGKEGQVAMVVQPLNVTARGARNTGSSSFAARRLKSTFDTSNVSSKG